MGEQSEREDERHRCAVHWGVGVLRRGVFRVVRMTLSLGCLLLLLDIGLTRRERGAPSSVLTERRRISAKGGKGTSLTSHLITSSLQDKVSISKGEMSDNHFNYLHMSEMQLRMLNDEDEEEARIIFDDLPEEGMYLTTGVCNYASKRIVNGRIVDCRYRSTRWAGTTLPGGRG